MCIIIGLPFFLSNILLRFLVFLGILKEMCLLSIHRSKSSRGRNESITTLVARKNNTRKEKPYLLLHT